MDLSDFIFNSLKEDIGEGDHTSLACIPGSAIEKARLMVKEDCVIAGVELAEKIFTSISPGKKFSVFLMDGSAVKKGDVVFTIETYARDILKGERLVLNCMQRMSGIATITRIMAEAIKGTGATLLDTRKTTPNFRSIEKWAVRIGGAQNHRSGLFDMILIKDNHIDYAGGVSNAIYSVKKYLDENDLDLKIEIEARNLDEVKEVIFTGGVNRIMLDNFTVGQTREAVKIIEKKFEIESSGNISLENIRDFAGCGVDFISVGALTHSYKSIDLSLKAVK